MALYTFSNIFNENKPSKQHDYLIINSTRILINVYRFAYIYYNFNISNNLICTDFIMILLALFTI